jgi:hypothetical protein
MMNEKLASLLETVRRTAVQAGDTAADAVYSAGKVAGELLNVAKLNVRIMDRKAAVNAALKEIGEILYATHTGNPSDSEVLLAKLREIDVLKAEIADMQARIKREEERRVCRTCGSAAKEDAVFCGECGEKL